MNFNQTHCMVVLLLFGLVLNTGCLHSEGEEPVEEPVEESLEEAKEILSKVKERDDSEVERIPFSKFWQAVEREGEKWAGDDFHLVKIESFRVNGHPSFDGSSVVWRAKIIKAESIRESRGEKTYRGKSKYVSMSKIRHVKAPKGLFVGKEKRHDYFGSAVKPSRLKITAEVAEEKAKQHKNFEASEFDGFVYQLKIAGKNKDTPVWVVVREFTSSGILKDEVSSEDSWYVKVNAETGDIIE